MENIMYNTNGIKSMWFGSIRSVDSDVKETAREGFDVRKFPSRNSGKSQWTPAYERTSPRKSAENRRSQTYARQIEESIGDGREIRKVAKSTICSATSPLFSLALLRRERLGGETPNCRLEILRLRSSCFRGTPQESVLLTLWLGW